jgi:hypothetical protein
MIDVVAAGKERAGARQRHPLGKDIAMSSNGSMKNGAALVKFDFHGDEIEVLHEDGRVWVGVKRLCDVLRIANQPQQAKLSRKPWATVTMIVTVAEDGRQREQFCIDLDSLPMWLATIEPSRVQPVLRPRLIDYQRECARVLRDHFLGQRTAAAAMSERSPRADLRDNPRQCAEVRRAIMSAAKICGVRFAAVEGIVRRRAQVLSYRRVLLAEVGPILSELDDLIYGRATLTRKSLPPAHADEQQPALPFPD